MPLTVSTHAIGRRKPLLLADFDVSPPGLGSGDAGDLLLRDLIEHIVRQQVRGFRDRQEQHRFDRVLSPAQIDQGARRGKVDPAGRSRPQHVDEEEAIGAALQGFEDGLYLVIIDGAERKSLEETVRLAPNSRLVFIRLTFLAGV